MTASDGASALVQRTDAVELALVDPRLRRALWLISPHFFDEPLRILAADEDVEGVTEREVVRESDIDDCVDDHPTEPKCLAGAVHGGGAASDGSDSLAWLGFWLGFSVGSCQLLSLPPSRTGLVERIVGSCRLQSP